MKRFRSQERWQKWLHAHHEKSQGLWIEFAKKASGVASVNYKEALEVALCYGWIDGQTASVDGTWYRQRFTPRRRRSKWSQINRASVERLHAEGRLAPAGIREMEAAQGDGRWAAAYPSPRNMTVPPDLEAALAILLQRLASNIAQLQRHLPHVLLLDDPVEGSPRASA